MRLAYFSRGQKFIAVIKLRLLIVTRKSINIVCACCFCGEVANWNVHVSQHTLHFSIMAGALALVVFSLLLCAFPSHALHPPSSNRMVSSNTTTADELSLLSFKSMLSGGPLPSWNSSGSYCSWPGVICGGRRHPDRVVALRLHSYNLSGWLSPSLGNLSFLQKLDLSDNQLVGQIPPELGRLIRLRLLNLSDNSLQGSIPAALRGCTKLTRLDLFSNQLQGEIPPRLAELTSMEYMSLGHNRLSGEIPPGLGNLSKMWYLALSFNMLSGSIPSSFGMLSSLSTITLSSNNLTGAIPISFWNISSLKFLVVQDNMLSGTIPPTK
ncbi:receptor kinase-like protein Xa21 [Brachypodium distachyon]|uniref:receptor kinase-like protein Xa21 n=1 Tax=Brachypodium distachyon TaxID=15368 RepID=UPI000D0CC77C|nr:receptor kinase-like protein Xa21 [Brachypodium distachyon]|eukprot:XP_024310932.1 receptor kinase-like protein Xa21 [Brachypodium distachyon]